MRFSFSSLVRLIVLLAVGSTMIAVGVARLDPPRPALRVKRDAHQVHINKYFFESGDRMPRWLDVDSGGLSSFHLGGDDLLEVASCSPWVDREGRRQVVGRWSNRSLDGPKSVSRDFGLARYIFPEGRLLDQVSTEILPVGPPCWFPGSRARILFASGDGMLYHFAFETEDRIGAEGGLGSEHDSRPRPLTWKCPRPGKGQVYISDLSWPDDLRMEGRIVVTLREQVEERGRNRSLSRSRLWWLKLNHAGTQIVDAGSLVAPGPGGETASGRDQRSPTVAKLPDGRAVLAYLQQSEGSSGWDLRMAPIRFEGEARTPSAPEADSRRLGDRCLSAPPSFSTDGQWLNAIVVGIASDIRVARFSIIDVLPAEGRP